MDPAQVLAFVSLMTTIKAREQLEFQATVGAIFDERRKEIQTQLAEIAFADDEMTRAAAIEAITRK